MNDRAEASARLGQERTAWKRITAIVAANSIAEAPIVCRTEAPLRFAKPAAGASSTRTANGCDTARSHEIARPVARALPASPAADSHEWADDEPLTPEARSVVVANT
jgi:hypothetical protein